MIGACDSRTGPSSPSSTFLTDGPQTRPRLVFAGCGRGCNSYSGRFVVHSVSVTPNNTVERLHATFEQRCGSPGPPQLRGERQDSLKQFVGKLLFLFKEWEMARVVKPDKFSMRSLDRLIVGPNQGRPGIRVVSSL